MTPREFEGEFGRPVTLTVDVPAAGSVVLPADPDRYVIVFWGTGTPVTIVPGEDPDGQLFGFSLTPNTLPVGFDHSHFGSLPGMAWTIRNAGARQSVTVLVGRMVRKPPPGRVKVVTRGKAEHSTEVSRSARNRNGRVPPQQ